MSPGRSGTVTALGRPRAGNIKVSNVVTRWIATVLAFCVAILPHTVQAQAQRLRSIELSIGSHALTAELAVTPETRSYGLKHRQQLPPDHGMLFVFEYADHYCFWMKDTPLALTIAFISERGVIINLADMQPYSTQSHCAHAPARYALEMEQGWFAKKRIQAGNRILQLPAAGSLISPGFR